MAFADRADAGRALASKLRVRLPLPHPLLLALPRGGVPVACEMAHELSLPIDIMLVRKFSLPDSPEKVAGTVSSGGVTTLAADMDPRLAQRDLKEAISREQAELERRELSYRLDAVAEPIEGRSIILVDDGLTTGYTMRAAIAAVRQLQPFQVIAAVPVASSEVLSALESQADAVVCARVPQAFFSVRRCYRDYSPVLDAEIRNLLAAALVARRPCAFRA